MFKPAPPPGPPPPDTYELELTAVVVPVVPVPMANSMMAGNPIMANNIVATSSSQNYSQGPGRGSIDMDDPERTLYQGYWSKTGICCCQGTSSAVAESAGEGEATDTNSNTRLDQKPCKIEITDSDVIYTTRTKLLPCMCCFGGCMQINTKTSALDGLTHVVAIEDKGQPECCGMFLMYVQYFIYFGCPLDRFDCDSIVIAQLCAAIEILIDPLDQFD